LTRASIRADLPYERATEFAAAPVGLATLLLPHLWGTNPTNYWGPWSSTEVLGYIGVLPLLLAILALPLWRTFHSVFFVGLAAVALLLSLGDATALFGWVYRFLPGFGMVRAAGRYLYLFDFGIALAAACGLDGLLRLAATPRWPPSDEQRAVGWAARFLAGALLCVLGVALPVLLAQQVAAADVLQRVVTAISDLFFLALSLAAALALLVAALLRWLSPRAVAALALLVATVDLGSAYHAFNPTTQDPLAGFHHAEILALLRADPDLFRIDSETGAISPWQPDSANLDALQDAGGLFNPLQLASYAALRAAVGRDYGAPAYDLLGVKYLVAPDDPAFAQALEQRAPGRFRLVSHADSLALYLHLGALARARVVYRAEPVADLDAALARLGDSRFDPRSTVLVEGPALADVSGDGASAPPATDARIVSYTPNRVEIAADAARAGYLVLADAAYPGWQARVDGVPTPVYVAYGAFRAVPLGAGTHRVELAFAPLSWEVGWRVSALSWALLLALAAWRALRARPRRHAPPP